jgi:hypothetical protein
MTAKSLRIEISIAGEQHLMTLLSKCLGVAQNLETNLKQMVALALVIK